MASEKEALNSSNMIIPRKDSPARSSELDPGLLEESPSIRTCIRWPKLSTDYQKCVKCQMRKNKEKLQSAQQ